MSESMTLQPIQVDGGDLYWDGDVAPSVAEVVVPIAAGIDVVVDAADTSTVVAGALRREVTPRHCQEHAPKPISTSVSQALQMGAKYIVLPYI